MCSALHPHRQIFQKNAPLKKKSTHGAKGKKEGKATKKARKCFFKVWLAWCTEIQPSHTKDTIIIDRVRLVSYYTFIGRLLHQFSREQRMLGWVGLLGFRNEQTHFLICSPPLRVQLTVVAERHLQRRPGRRRGRQDINHCVFWGILRLSNLYVNSFLPRSRAHRWWRGRWWGLWGPQPAASSPAEDGPERPSGTANLKWLLEVW